MSDKGLNPKDLVGAKKAPLGLVPPALTIGAAEAMAIGAEKYGPFNWREKPVEVMTYVEAALRHLLAFMDGQDLAEDSKVHHLKHVLAGVGIVLDSIELDIAVDNRPQRGPAADMLRVLDKSEPTQEERMRSAVEAALYGRPTVTYAGRPLGLADEPIYFADTPFDPYREAYPPRSRRATIGSSSAGPSDKALAEVKARYGCADPQHCFDSGQHTDAFASAPA